MKIKELKDGMIVSCRTGMAGRNGVEWDGPFHDETLYVSKNQNGEILIVSLRSKPWAEAGLADFNPNENGGTFVVEDWYLQIEELEA